MHVFHIDITKKICILGHFFLKTKIKLEKIY